MNDFPLTTYILILQENLPFSKEKVYYSGESLC